MSNSVRPHRRQPTRLPRPWDSPGKNTGVGCLFLLQCRKVESESEVAQSCPTVSDPMVCSLPGSSIHGIFQARVLEWRSIAFSNKVTYSETNVVSWVGRNREGWEREDTKEHMVTFGSDNWFHYLVWGNGFMSISMCQNLLNCTI